MTLVAAHAVADQIIGLHDNQRPADIGALLVLTALFGVLSTAIIRNWRWTFWLILVAFMAGTLRVPFAACSSRGSCRVKAPPGYLSLLAIVGLIQFVIALAMLAGYRKAGAWGEF